MEEATVFHARKVENEIIAIVNVSWSINERFEEENSRTSCNSKDLRSERKQVFAVGSNRANRRVVNLRKTFQKLTVVYSTSACALQLSRIVSYFVVLLLSSRVNVIFK
ncbi:unnamed protein product [Hermetia illucens]|uniref:Uncharacterized protein n=1 Tax=Hermetia illucens TaxID=343691 RepID=A0A7R8YZM4_HERIL|nr:unnamed protein product [Hermetia illucens]